MRLCWSFHTDDTCAHIGRCKAAFRECERRLHLLAHPQRKGKRAGGRGEGPLVLPAGCERVTSVRAGECARREGRG